MIVSRCLAPLLPAALEEKPFFFQVLKVRLQSLTFSLKARRYHSHLLCPSSCDACAYACDSCACVYAFSSFSCVRVYDQTSLSRWQHGGRHLDLIQC